MVSKFCCGRLVIALLTCENVGDMGSRDEWGLKAIGIIEQGGALWMICLDLLRARKPWITWLESFTKHGQYNQDRSWDKINYM